ncbi:MAG: replication initiator, partial [Dermatophilaceae bacterium]
TLTLPSYGRVRDGVPVNPETYDYRRAALDALLFPRLLDRFWQNLRRCAAYKVQYFSAVEAQRHLAPHLHAAVRGAIPRATLRAVVRATYYAAWWPSVDRVVYADERIPLWDSDSGQYVDPDTGEVLPTWDQAVDELDEPVHVVSFGTQLDIKGILGGSEQSAGAVRATCAST